MERLTFITDVGVSIAKNEDCPTMSICGSCDIPSNRCPYIIDALRKLAEYENTELTPELIEAMKGHNIALIEQLNEYQQLEEQGLLLKPKCKDGQIVYMKSHYWGIIPYKVNSISYSKLTGFVYEVIASDNDDILDDQEIDDSDFGEIAFFTEEEAMEHTEKEK